VRVLLSLSLAVLIYPLLSEDWVSGLPKNIATFVFFCIKELAVGLFIGYTAKIAFEALVGAAQIVSFQMGFGTATLLMPGADSMMDSFTAFHRSLIVLFFLSLNLHQIYIDALIKTFQVIPAGGLTINNSIGAYFISITANLFIVAMQLAAPVIISLMFAMAALGLMARTVPQLNVFVLSFPISFALGLIVYMGILPYFPSWIGSYFESSRIEILTVLRGLAP
jgi:flagellar biosynthetic protein FliR